MSALTANDLPAPRRRRSRGVARAAVLALLACLVGFAAPSPAEAAPPARPTDFQARAGNGLIWLSWDESSDTTITGYEYSLLTGTDFWISIPNSGSGEANSSFFTVIDRVRNTISYAVRLRAVNADGHSDYRQAVRIIPNSDISAELQLNTDNTIIVEQDTLTDTVNNRSYVPITVLVSVEPRPTQGTTYLDCSLSATSASTATEGGVSGDYVFANNGSPINTAQVLPNDEWSQNFIIWIYDDGVTEEDETLVLNASCAGENESGARPNIPPGSLGTTTLTLTISDAPTVTLVLGDADASIDEDGGSSTVTATLSSAATEVITLTVAATPGIGAVAEDFILTGTELTFAVGATTSTGDVTIVAVNNAVDAPDKTVTVSATVAGVDPLRLHPPTSP